MILKKIIFAYKFRKAVKKADTCHDLTGLRYFVIMLNGRLHVVPKKTVRNLVNRRRFKKGISVQDIQKRALYITL
jgi:hypothetical protein